MFSTRNIIVVAWLFVSTLGYGQYGITGQDPVPHWHLEAYLDIGVPVGDYGTNMNQNGVGFGASLIYNVQGPIWVGISGRGTRYDNFRVSYFDQSGGELFEIEEITASRQAQVHALFRFEPLKETVISPYVEGGVGMHWFFTNTKLTDVEFSEQIDRFSELKDSRFGVALYGGIRVSPKSIPAVGLEIRVGYVYNAQVEYMGYNENIVLEPNAFPVEAFQVFESVVDIISIDIGVSYRF